MTKKPIIMVLFLMLGCTIISDLFMRMLILGPPSAENTMIMAMQICGATYGLLAGLIIWIHKRSNKPEKPTHLICTKCGHAMESDR